VELSLFDEVAEAVRGFVPRDLGAPRIRARRYGIKVWFGPNEPPREHYEVQVIPARYCKGAKAVALEIGFHTEHPQVADNDRVIAQLAGAERQWRRAIGKEAVVGPFLGRAKVWRRVSETWPDPDLDDPGLGTELGARLTDYVAALEPVRRKDANA
jgi:hypothetical protein